MIYVAVLYTIFMVLQEKSDTDILRFAQLDTDNRQSVTCIDYTFVGLSQLDGFMTVSLAILLVERDQLWFFNDSFLIKERPLLPPIQIIVISTFAGLIEQQTQP